MQRVYTDMTPTERHGWQLHLKRFPPGDFLAQAILAHIWCQRIKDGRPEHIAPWLFDIEEKFQEATATQAHDKMLGMIQDQKEQDD